MEKNVILAVDIGGAKYVVGLVKDNGKIISKKRYVWKHISAESVVEEICSAMTQMIRENPEVIISAVGITIPGLVDTVAGVWKAARFMGIYDLPIGKIISQQFGYPVFIDNDCNASAIAERMYGLCKKTDHFIYLTVSNSIGGALFLNGQLYRGAFGNAGEIGNCRVDENMKPGKGKRDILENYASGRGLVATYLKLGGSPKIDGEAPEGLTITRLARAGDPISLKAFEMEGRYLGQVIASCCAVLDPEKVIIGGGLSLAFDQYKDHLMDTVREELRIATVQIPKIRPTGLGYDGGLLGAAAVAVCELEKSGGLSFESGRKSGFGC